MLASRSPCFHPHTCVCLGCYSKRWTHNNISNDNNREQHTTTTQQQNILNTNNNNQLLQDSRKSLIFKDPSSMSSNDTAWYNETSQIIAYCITQELGSSYDGANILVDLASEAPDFAHDLYEKIRPSKLTDTQLEGIISITNKIKLDPRSYGQAIKRTYTLFLEKSPNFTPGNPTPGMVVVFITFIVELCRRFINEGYPTEVPMVHKHTIRIMTDKTTPLSPFSWEQFNNDLIRRPNGIRGLERRPSFAVEAISTMLSIWEMYYNYTRS